MKNKVVELDLNDVLPNRFQPRIKFSEESIQELANSIKEHGVIQPIVVRKLDDKYEIIAGERRYKASVLAGKETIPAIITNLSEKDSAEVALIENVQRKDLTPIEEAISYKKILDMGYLTQDVLATKLGKNQSTIANKLRLLNLDDDVQEALLNEQISERHARSLLKLPKQSMQRELLKRIINERLTVRRTDEEIDKMMNDNEFLNNNQPAENNYVEEVEELEIFDPNFASLNIPTAPIVDDTIPEFLPNQEEVKENIFRPEPEIITPSIPPIIIPEEELTKPIEETKMEDVISSNVNNPGFMDIDKIEEEATEIFTSKPLAPMDNLLEPSQELMIPDPVSSEVEEEEEDVEDILIPGKFFSLLPEEEKEEINQEEPTVDNFNFNLDVDNFNNFEQTNNVESIEVEQATNVLEPSQSIEVNEETKEEPIFNDFNPMEENTISIEPISNQNLSFNDELEIPNIEKDTIPELNQEISPIVEPITEALPLDNNLNSGTDLKSAINMIRDLSVQLSRLGFIIDTEEFDFEDMYQVTFKINK